MLHVDRVREAGQGGVQMAGGGWWGPSELCETAALPVVKA